MKETKSLTEITVATALVTGISGTVYSSVADFSRCTGFAAVLLTNSAATATITVTQQASSNGSDWYDCVDQNNSAIGQVQVITTTATTRYVQFDPVVARWIRFKIVESAGVTTNVTIKLIFQE